ncbi:MAG: hypothetical protein OEW04_15850, partial [Nitrospirota bacterium]|nr:hypothetical protein [Nitrospirota bacterium]
KSVIPAKAGIRNTLKTLDSRLHGNDKKGQMTKTFDFEIGSSQFSYAPWSLKRGNEIVVAGVLLRFMNNAF